MSTAEKAQDVKSCEMVVKAIANLCENSALILSLLSFFFYFFLVLSLLVTHSSSASTDNLQVEPKVTEGIEPLFKIVDK